MRNKTRFGSEINNEYGLQPFITTSYPSSYKHTIYMKNILEHPEEMVSAIDIMINASEDDTVQIFLNSGGGRVDSLDSLLYAMEKCKAPIHCVGSGTIASCATFILINCDTFELSPYTRLLFHNATFGIGGESRDVLELANFEYKQCEKFLREMYEPFMTEEELHDIIVNKRQMWMTAEEFIDRWEKLSEEQSGGVELNENLLNKVGKKDLIRFILGEIRIDGNGKVIEK